MNTPMDIYTQDKSEQDKEGKIIPETGGRIHWIDFARFFAALILVIQHGNLLGLHFIVPRNYIATLLWDHSIVALFFFFSGYFTRPNRSWFATKRFLFIFIPYCIWCLASGLIHCSSIEFTSIKYWLNVFGIVPFCKPINGPLWFLEVLMLVSLISPIFVRAKTSHLLLIMFSLLFACEEHISIIPTKAIMGVAFYFFGVIVNRFPSIIDFIKSNYLLLLACCTFFSTLEVFRNYAEANQNHPIGIFIGILFYIALSFFLEKFFPRILSLCSKFGKYAFFIYATHYFLLELMIPGLNRQIKNTFLLVTISTIVPFFLVFLQIAVCKAIEKISPKLLPYLAMMKTKK